jgi:16S rRNA (uracil1498-N3)-methyltransferase
VATSRVADVPPGCPAAATIVVGPEGGWTEAEIALARPHGRALGLGDRTLRADAAAVVAVTALLTRWGAL